MKLAVACAGLLLVALPARAGIVLGGGLPETDCWAAFDLPAASDGGYRITSARSGCVHAST